MFRADTNTDAELSVSIMSISIVNRLTFLQVTNTATKRSQKVILHLYYVAPKTFLIIFVGGAVIF